MQGHDDQIVPYPKDASLLQAKFNSSHVERLRPTEALPHGMMTTNADVINADLLAFIRS